jgi:Domain of unknown function (DUF397)
MTGPAWRKSSWSANNGACVEVAAWRKSSHSRANGDCVEVAGVDPAALAEAAAASMGVIERPGTYIHDLAVEMFKAGFAAARALNMPIEEDGPLRLSEGELADLRARYPEEPSAGRACPPRQAEPAWSYQCLCCGTVHHGTHICPQAGGNG